MHLFKTKGPPDVEKLQAKHDVKGLLKALLYEEGDDVPATQKVTRDVQRNATNALSELGPELDASAVEPLAHVLGSTNAIANGEPCSYFAHPNNGVRQRAASLLGGIGEPAADALVADLSDYDEGVRLTITSALTQIGDPAVAKVVAVLRDSRDDGVRAKAAEALGDIGSPLAVDPLVEVLRGDPSPFVRVRAVVALGRIGDPRAVQPLIDALDDNAYAIDANAALYLDKFGGPQAEQALKAYRSRR